METVCNPFSKITSDLEAKHYDLEELIYNIASIDKKYMTLNRTKRAISLGHTSVAASYAFAHKEWVTSILGNSVLSPYAFYHTMGSPNILKVKNILGY